MLWKSYRSLSHRERALVDGRLITYHFYVGGITLALLGLIDAFRAGAHEKLGLVVAGLALAWGLTAIVIGVALHFVHRWMIRSPQRDEYLAIVTVVLGRYHFPVVPAVLWGVVALSLLALAQRLLGI